MASGRRGIGLADGGGGGRVGRAVLQASVSDPLFELTSLLWPVLLSFRKLGPDPYISKPPMDNLVGASPSSQE